MTRINTNVSSLLAQQVLQQQNQVLNTSLQRLSTGLQINSGADNPAGLIASENLRGQNAAITSAVNNAQRADQVVGIAEGGLSEVSGLLTQLQGLVTQSANSAGQSADEKQANQLQIDSILQSIDRIANSTNFEGVKLLNGTFDYTLSNHDNTKLSQVQVNAAKIPTNGYIGVTANVVTSAQTGAVYLSAGTGNVLSGTSLTIEVAGNKGVQQFTFASGTSGTDIAAAINTFKSVTGVSAAVNGAYVQFNSLDFGSSQFVSVTKISGDSAYNTAINNTAATGGSTTSKDAGRDAVVNINGSQAQTDGLTAHISTGSLDLSVTLASGSNTTGGTSTFQITGGGATFALSPTLDLAGQASLGIQSVTTGNLGDAINGHLSDLASGGTANVVSGDLETAQNVINSAITQVATLRGRLGSFQANTVQPTISSLNVALENSTAAESQIRDTDFAQETANLTRAQILVQAATNVLQIANTTPSNVLTLLKGA